jgi:hypothetical protein
MHNMQQALWDKYKNLTKTNSAYWTTCDNLPAAYSAAMVVSGKALILLALPAVPNC